MNGLVSPSELCHLARDWQFDGMFDGKDSGFTPCNFSEFTILGLEQKPGSRILGWGGLFSRVVGYPIENKTHNRWHVRDIDEDS